MSLSQTTQRVLRIIEERSGIPVHVEPDPNLPGTILAKVVMARGNLRLHQVFYRPNSSVAADHLICRQAGYILRLFETPAEKRYDFAATNEADSRVERLVQAHPVSSMLPEDSLPKFCAMLRDGLLSHLRSIPIGMRVDSWLADEFPELATLQKTTVLQEVQDMVNTLAPQHRRMAPEKIFDSTQSISAAFAAFWSLRLNQPQLTLPFKAAGFLERGADLLQIWHSVPQGAEHDRHLIDAWAEKLGVAGWYQWVPYSAPK